MTNATNKDQTTTNRKEETTMTTTQTFKDLLRNYEQYVINPNADTSKSLTELATAVTYSVLKKCIDVSQNPTLIQARRELTRDIHNLDCLAYASNHATETQYNADGERYTAIVDKDINTALTSLCSQTLGDGIDLVHDAITAILEETNKAIKRNVTVPLTEWLEQPYEIRRLKKKVWIKVEDSINGWETVTTTPIQEIYKAVRRAINQSRAVQTDPRNGYTYLSTISTDLDSGIDEIIYRRFGKYADIGGAVTDINGRETAYTTDEQTAQDYDTLIQRLNLTKREGTILQLRLSGYGYKAIATYMGISVDNAKRCVHRLREKATAIDFTP